MSNTMYWADLLNTGEREQVLIIGYSDQSGTKDDPCACYCCENITNPPPQNVYLPILRWRHETLSSSWLTKKFEQK
jgi:hypothetical protein